MITLQERVHSSMPPAGWSLNKLHRVFRVRKGYKNTAMQEDNLLSLSYGRIIRKSIDAAEGLLPESFETYQIVEPGNIVMRLTDLQNDKRSLRQGLVKERGIITSAYDALELNKGHDPRFWAYALLALDLAKYYYSLGGGVRQSIKFADFPNDWIAVPEPQTQSRIADFLDREIKRIDRLIIRKKNLISILEERGQAELDSAIDSIEDSQCMKSKLGFFLTKVGSGKTPRGGAEVYVEQGIRFLRSQNVYNDGLRLEEVAFIDDETDEGMASTRVKEGDVLLNITGGSLGRCAVVKPSDLPANVSQHVSILRPSMRIIPEFLHLTILSRKVQDIIRMESFSANREGLTSDDIKNLPIKLPYSRSDQLRITSKLAEKLAYKALAIEKTQKSLVSLAEHRTSLITSAVTGLIDVSTYQVGSRDYGDLHEFQEAMRA